MWLSPNCAIFPVHLKALAITRALAPLLSKSFHIDYGQICLTISLMLADNLFSNWQNSYDQPLASLMPFRF